MSEKSISINKVEGFDPSQYARTIQDTNGQKSLYLDVQYRKMWFRLCNPTGKIVQKIHTFDGSLAVVEARIYADKNDPEDAFLSNAFAQRCADANNPEYGNRYLETAATAAVGRALADAGYGLQFCLERDEKPVDSGQQIQATPVESIIDEAVAQQQKEPQQAGQIQQNTTVPPVQPQPNQMQSVQSPQSVNKGTSQLQVQYPQYEGRSVEEIMQEMSYNEAIRFVYRTRNKGGRHDGETLGQIAEYAFKDIEWIVFKYAGINTAMKAAARIIYDAHSQQAAQ